MDEKLYLTDLNCYGRADEKQKKNVKELKCYNKVVTEVANKI